jgi:hypothetical protein
MNGMTYHPQNVVLVPWFKRESPSSALHNAYTYPDGRWHALDRRISAGHTALEQQEQACYLVKAVIGAKVVAVWFYGSQESASQIILENGAGSQ